MVQVIGLKRKEVKGNGYCSKNKSPDRKLDNSSGSEQTQVVWKAIIYCYLENKVQFLYF